MSEWIISIFLLFASIVVLLAAIGLLRLPDLPTRMHATTKSGVLAVILVMIAVAIFFASADITVRVIAIIIFTCVTAPIAAHAIGRAGYLSGVRLWSETSRDDLQDYYKSKEDERESDNIL